MRWFAQVFRTCIDFCSVRTCEYIQRIPIMAAVFKPFRQKKICSVLGCFDVPSKRHRFPRTSGEIVFEKWVIACRNPKISSLTKDEICKKLYICDRHFSEDSKCPELRRGLKKDAVPTLFLPAPEVRDFLHEDEGDLRELPTRRQGPTKRKLPTKRNLPIKRKSPTKRKLDDALADICDTSVIPLQRRRHNGPLPALKESLEKSGQLGRMKGEIRAEIFNALHRGGVKPQMPKATLALNELIREYLDWSGYHYSSTVLVAESGLPDEPLGRPALLEDLGVIDTEETKQLPLLFSLVSSFRNKVKQ